MWNWGVKGKIDSVIKNGVWCARHVWKMINKMGRGGEVILHENNT